MKKFTSLFIAIALLLSMLPMHITGTAATQASLTFQLNADGESYCVTKCDTSASGEMEIPATYEGKPVTAISERAFYGCNKLTGIAIPKSIQQIGMDAFDNCSNLEAVYIDDLVAWCAAQLKGSCSSPFFYGGGSLYLNGEKVTNLVIPEGVESIGNHVFSGCSITSATIPASVKTIGAGVFNCCKNLASVKLPEGLERIPSSVFQSCTSLTGITIPDSVTYIDKYAFNRCTGLTSITIPDNVTTIDAYAFHGCSSLQELRMGVGVQTIGDYAFAYCRYIPSVTLSDSVEALGEGAFYNCIGLTQVVIGEGPKSIGVGAFGACSALQTVGYRGAESDKAAIEISRNNTPLLNATWYYHFCQSEHIYGGNCDTTCNNCGFYRATSTSHIFSNSCDTSCNVCGDIRQAHNLAWIVDRESTCGFSGIKHQECADCHAKLNENTEIPATGAHSFTDEFDQTCNGCAQIHYPIILIANGTTIYSATRVAPGGAFTIPSTAPARSDYNFAGWSTSKSGDVIYQPEDTVSSINEALILYAQWDKLCANCSGTGTKRCATCIGTGLTAVTETCYGCDGGKIACSQCNRWLYRSYEQMKSLYEVLDYNAGGIWDGKHCYGYRCPYCGNFGSIGTSWNYPFVECDVCHASGSATVQKTCDRCSGSGVTKCKTCSGWGEVIRTAVSAPHAPTLQKADAYTVTLNTITNGEYSIDGINWQDSPVFGNLETGREYQFYQRYAKTDTTYASEASAPFSILVHQHTFDNDCDQLCNLCDYTRVTSHQYEWVVDSENTCGTDGVKHEECTVCHDERNVGTLIPATGAHRYDNGCDAECNVCGEGRSVGHIYAGDCDESCDICGYLRTPTAMHDTNETGLCQLCGAQEGIRADVDGNGRVNMKDWNRLYEHLSEVSELTGDGLKYADVNKDGKVNMKDWNRLYEHLSETNPLW